MDGSRSKESPRYSSCFRHIILLVKIATVVESRRLGEFVVPSSVKYFWANYEDEDLLDVRLCDLGVTIKDSWVERPITKLYDELKAKHIRLNHIFGCLTNWFCPDGVPGFAVPFFLSASSINAA